MDNPGAFSLGDFSVSDAGRQTGATVEDLGGMASLGLFARFAYGASQPAAQGQPGPLVEAYVQTSLDQGKTWCDICCFAFTTGGGVLVANLGGAVPLGPPVVATNGALADNTCVQGLLGDQLRVLVVTTGTYADSTLLSLWGVAR